MARCPPPVRPQMAATGPDRPMLTLTPSKTLSDEPICSHTCSMDHLMISQYWRKSADTIYCAPRPAGRLVLKPSATRARRLLRQGRRARHLQLRWLSCPGAPMPLILIAVPLSSGESRGSCPSSRTPCIHDRLNPTL